MFHVFHIYSSGYTISLHRFYLNDEAIVEGCRADFFPILFFQFIQFENFEFTWSQFH